MTIWLIGYRGCGKTTVARLLGERLSVRAIDADDEIERRAGKSIADIFAEQGETAFRDLESAVIADLVRQAHDAVVSLGGGALNREENRRALAGAGRLVWLAASPETLYARISADSATASRRPNLTSAGGLEEIRELLAKRAAIYRQCATAIVDTEGLSPQQVAERILEIASADAASQ